MRDSYRIVLEGFTCTTETILKTISMRLYFGKAVL